MNKRQIELIKFLSKQTDWIKGIILANHLEVSGRTIRTDIQMINSIFSKDNELIISSKQNGYLLSDKKAANGFIHSFQKSIPSSSEERIIYLLRKLLYTSEMINLYDVADELFVSESTIEKDIQRIKLLYLTDLELERRDNQLFLVGKEKNKRSLLVKVLFTEAKENMFDIRAYSNYFNRVKLEDIKEILYSIMKKHKISFSDMAFMNMVLHIAIITDKVLLNEEPISTSEFNVIYADEDRALVKEICYSIGELYDITYPCSEMNYIALLIGGKKTTRYKGSKRSEIEKNVSPFYLNLTRHLIQSVQEKFFIDLQKDDELFVGLCMHIQELHKRLNRDVILRNPILEETKKTFPLIYEMAIFVGNLFSKLIGQAITDDEIGLITLHLCAAFERTPIKSTQKKRVAILCPTGFASSQLIKAKLQKYAAFIDEVSLFSLSDMEQVLLFEPDIILSTVDIEISTSCRVLLVSPFITETQERQLNDFFLETEKNEMLLGSEKYFDECLFFNHLDFSTSDQVIGFLSKQLYEHHYVPEDYEKYIKKRELLAPTSFGNLLALPHPSEKVAYKTMISVGILANPITWGTQPVQVVLLFALANDGEAFLDSLFRDLISLLDNQNKMKNIIRSTSFQEFLTEMTKK
ncbi:BglG family transcription antiterminator [Bacillus salipaludis]|uniref:BglG family transcription antiterminator n=1 Tax=Bacillus salipaludis TaxID=2547811 RepID=A0ABW8RPB5_9BACI